MKFFFIEKYIMKLIWKESKPTGGASVQSLVWMEAFNALKHEVFLAKLEEDNYPINTKYTWIKLKPLFNSNKKIFAVWFIYRFPKIFTVIKNTNPDYIYTSMPTWDSFFVGLICKILNKRHIIRIASDVNVDHRLKEHQTNHKKFFILRSYKLADLIIAQNEYQYSKLIEKFPKKRIFKLPNPIIINENYSILKDSFTGYIAWVANFRRVKNMELLYEIASSLKDEKFKIAGVALPSMDIETLLSVNKLKELPNVEFCGSIERDKILDFFAASKFLLNTSDFEGFSNTFLEAMVTGTPILTTQNVNPDEIISKYHLGIVYKDVQNLSALLIEISNEKYVEYSTNCIKYVKNNHDHLVLGKKLIEILNNLD